MIDGETGKLRSGTRAVAGVEPMDREPLVGAETAVTSPEDFEELVRNENENVLLHLAESFDGPSSAVIEPTSPE